MWDAIAVVAYADLDFFTEVFGTDGDGGLVLAIGYWRLATGIWLFAVSRWLLAFCLLSMPKYG